jgi:methionyl aminopeptidase
MSKLDKLTAMREGGQILATILTEIKSKTYVGMKTTEIDDMARRLCLKYRVKPSFLNYDGYPSSICVSINDEVVHGIPGNYTIKNGDLVSLDFGVYYAGYHTDSAITFGIGNISAEAHRLMQSTERSLMAGIAEVRPGAHIGAIGSAVQKEAEKSGFGVVRALVGHAIGKQVHEEPYIPNYGNKHDGPIIVGGTALAIEPMITAGDFEVVISEDDWTYKTRDGSLSAHFEHTVWVHPDGAEILTQLR